MTDDTDARRSTTTLAIPKRADCFGGAGESTREVASLIIVIAKALRVSAMPGTAAPLNVDMGIYHAPGTNRTTFQYRKVKRTSEESSKSKKQRREETVSKRLNKTARILDFYEKKSTRVYCCCQNNCLVNLLGHADDSELQSVEQLSMKDKFMRQVIASR